MNFSLLLPLAVLMACSHPKKTERPVSTEVARPVHSAPVKECLDYQFRVLEPAYKETSENNSVTLKFIEGQEAAESFITQFDPKKGLSREAFKLIRDVTKRCTPEKVAEFDRKFREVNQCSLYFSEMNFLRALSKGIHDYPWTNGLKARSRNTLMHYVHYNTHKRLPLLNRLMAIGVLDEMIQNKQVPARIRPELDRVKKEAAAHAEDLRVKLDAEPSLDCNGIKVLKHEILYSDQIGKKLEALLKRI